MRSLRISWIVHGFALLHLAVAYFSAQAGIQDSRLLTLMTLIMTLVVCVREQTTLEVTCLSFVLLNIGGYYLGMEVMRLMAHATDDLLSPLNQGLSSCITTEVLGWSLYSLLHFSGNTFKISQEEGENYWDRRFWVVALCVVVVFGVRSFIGVLASEDLQHGENIYAYFHGYLENYPLLLLLLAANLFSIRRLLKLAWPAWGRLGLFGGVFLLLTFGVAYVQSTGLPFQYKTDFQALAFLRQLLVAAIIELLLAGMTYLGLQVLLARRRARQEETEAHQARFQYHNLKQQVNPHFLFNSLNTLDGLILENKSEQASEYVHKLSGLYRYMLRNEGSRLVPLRAEMEYTRHYVDLLMVRFPQGLRVQFDVRDEDLDRQVVPCSVQLLVENAVQHNTTASACPLEVRVASDGRVLSVENRLQLKQTRLATHAVGQRYIRQQYRDLKADITIVQDAERYRVELPLL